VKTLRDLRATPQKPLSLAPHRVHEAEGRGRRQFALFQALRHPGPVVWILPDHSPERPMPAGLPPGLAERLMLLTPRGRTDLLWSVEEALKTAPVALVIAEPPDALSLTEGRRLQLSAEAGQTTGLLLIRQGQACNAAESRWSCDPLPAKGPSSSPERQDSTRHRWSLIKNKKGTTADWMVDWDGATPAFHLVSATGERLQPAEKPL
jgi:protein ImuA